MLTPPNRTHRRYLCSISFHFYVKIVLCWVRGYSALWGYTRRKGMRTTALSYGYSRVVWYGVQCGIVQYNLCCGVLWHTAWFGSRNDFSRHRDHFSCSTIWGRTVQNRFSIKPSPQLLRRCLMWTNPTHLSHRPAMCDWSLAEHHRWWGDSTEPSHNYRLVHWGTVFPFEPSHPGVAGLLRSPLCSSRLLYFYWRISCWILIYILKYTNRYQPRSSQRISTSHLDLMMFFCSGNVLSRLFPSALIGLNLTGGLRGCFSGWTGRDGTCSLQNGSIGSTRYLLHRSLPC